MAEAPESQPASTVAAAPKLMPHLTNESVDQSALPTWARLFLIVLTVGGGVTGLTSVLVTIFNPNIGGILNVVMGLMFVAMYAYVIVAGLILVVHPERTLPMIFAFIPQIAFWSTTPLSFRFISGPWVRASYADYSYYFGFQIGSEWGHFIDRAVPLQVGVNLLAIVIVASLIAHRLVRSKPNATLSH